ncbi:MAM and LDL-receptor class A domain-containing protein 1-like, partial [Mustelus asterias]
GGIGRPLKNITGDQGQQWRQAEVVYCGSSPVQFVLEGVMGKTLDSFLAVDKICIIACGGTTATTANPPSSTSTDVQPSTNEPTTSATTHGPTTGTTVTTLDSTTDRPLTTLSTTLPTSSPTTPPECNLEETVKGYLTRCDFNNNTDPFCGWIQPSSSDDGDWSRTRGSTLTRPLEDQPPPWDKEHKGGYYIHQDAGNLLPGRFIRLESPAVTVRSDGACVQFSYYLYGPFPADGAMLRVLLREGERETPLWNRTVPQSHAWLQGAVTIPGQTGRTIKIFFDAVRGQSSEARVALDNVAITTGPCFACISGCDFDEGMCGWTTEMPVGDGQDEGWIQGIGQAVDFTKPGFGLYMLIDPEFNQPGHRFHLKSPAVRSSQCLSLTFRYYLTGTAAMVIYAQGQGGGIGRPLKNITGDQGQQWRQAEVVYCGSSPVQFVLEGVMGKTLDSFLAVDKICIIACGGTTTTTANPPSSTSKDVQPSTNEPTTSATTHGPTTGTTVTTLDSTTDRPLTTLSTTLPTSSPTTPPECNLEETVKGYLTRCDFNNNTDPFCGWIQPSSSDNGDWSRTRGSTLTRPLEDQPPPWDKEHKGGKEGSGEQGRGSGYFLRLQPHVGRRVGAMLLDGWVTISTRTPVTSFPGGLSVSRARP